MAGACLPERRHHSIPSAGRGHLPHIALDPRLVGLAHSPRPSSRFPSTAISSREPLVDCSMPPKFKCGCGLAQQVLNICKAVRVHRRQCCTVHSQPLRTCDEQQFDACIDPFSLGLVTQTSRHPPFAGKNAGLGLRRLADAERGHCSCPEPARPRLWCAAFRTPRQPSTHPRSVPTPVTAACVPGGAPLQTPLSPSPSLSFSEISRT